MTVIVDNRQIPGMAEIEFPRRLAFKQEVLGNQHALGHNGHSSDN